MKSCLLVDDSGVVRKVARRIIEELGFTCTEAENGQQALEACQNGALPDAILLDWGMPVMNGLEFLKHLRKMPGGKDVTIVLCSTRNQRAHVKKALKSGANDFVMKPFDRDIIHSKFILAGLVNKPK